MSHRSAWIRIGKAVADGQTSGLFCPVCDDELEISWINAAKGISVEIRIFSPGCGAENFVRKTTAPGPPEKRRP